MARQIDKLRAEVGRAERLVSSKLRRIEKSGARVIDSPYNPIRAGKIGRYNSTQLSNYLDELNSFRDRKVQFVAGAKGAPIPQHVANRYESVRRTYNRISARDFAEVAGIRLPSGMTVGEREEAFRPRSRAVKGAAANRLRGRFDIDISKVTSASGAAQIEKMLLKRLRESDYAQKHKLQKHQLMQLVRGVGEPDLVDEVGKLTEKQVNVLWNYTDFAETVSGRYESMKNLSVQQEAQTSDEFRSEIQGILKWAKGIR